MGIAWAVPPRAGQIRGTGAREGHSRRTHHCSAAAADRRALPFYQGSPAPPHGPLLGSVASRTAPGGPATSYRCASAAGLAFQPG